jgi:hypothetical protein
MNKKGQNDTMSTTAQGQSVSADCFARLAVGELASRMAVPACRQLVAQEGNDGFDPISGWHHGCSCPT